MLTELYWIWRLSYLTLVLSLILGHLFTLDGSLFIFFAVSLFAFGFVFFHVILHIDQVILSNRRKNGVPTYDTEKLTLKTHYSNQGEAFSEPSMTATIVGIIIFFIFKFYIYDKFRVIQILLSPLIYGFEFYIWKIMEISSILDLPLIKRNSAIFLYSFVVILLTEIFLMFFPILIPFLIYQRIKDQRTLANLKTQG